MTYEMLKAYDIDYFRGNYELELAFNYVLTEIDKHPFRVYETELGVKYSIVSIEHSMDAILNKIVFRLVVNILDNNKLSVSDWGKNVEQSLHIE